ncbi:MAG: hypothetical protein M1837_002615 [Sclerophora amabilis]|nr:MAG: hypothetical protein M1837_002615 [Sclerophora amabilis]
MSLPLSPLGPMELNLKSPSSERRKDGFQSSPSFRSPQKGTKSESPRKDESQLIPSSPFVADPFEQENMYSQKGPSPKKTHSPTKSASPKKRPPLFHEESRARECDSPIKMCQNMEDDSFMIHEDPEDEDNNTTLGGPPGFDGMDDTAFSTFSAVPNADMTLFAKVGQNAEHRGTFSPSKQLQMESSGVCRDRVSTPEEPDKQSIPGTIRKHTGNDNSPSLSPTPRRNHKANSDNDTTNLILDFTEQFNALASSSSSYNSVSPSRRGRQSPTKSQTHPDLSVFSSRGRTPSPAKYALPQQTPSERRHLANLLDFDIPPPPTPRSVPSITARELESLKSGYLSQISSLKATLSGKEAEVNSLKEAVGDAERRVGEAQESVREERGAKEVLQADKGEWEKRGTEMEKVLRTVKEEILREEREKEEFAQKLEESERKREEAETKAAEAETRFAGMRASVATSSSENPSENSKEVEVAVEKVARELHSLYRSKHETKVSALKRSYEARWEKRVKEVERKLEEVNKENDELRIGRDVTMSGVVPAIPLPTATEDQEAGRIEEARKTEEHKARLVGLNEELASIKRDNDHLIRELEKERVEKGDLVGAVEEMLSMSAAGNGSDTPATSSLEDFRSSFSRASSMKPPTQLSGSGGGESRIGRMNSGGSLKLNRSISGSSSTIGRSGIMSNIERMGRGRAE